MTKLSEIYIPSAKELLVYRSIKSFCEKDIHPTLQEIADDIEMYPTTVDYCVKNLIKCGLIFKRADTSTRHLRVNNDPDADVKVIHDGGNRGQRVCAGLYAG